MTNQPTTERPPKPAILTAADPTVTRIMPELAAEIGLNESVMLVQIAFWIKISDHFEDGQWWTYQSVRSMHEKAFPYWSAMTINRTAQSLVRQELVTAGNFNKRAGNKTRWFALNMKGLSKLKSIRVEGGLYQNDTGLYQNDTTLPEITPETTQEQKEKEKDSAPENGAGSVVVSQVVEEKATPLGEIKPLTEQQVLVGVTSKALDGLAYSIAPTYVKFFTGKTTPDDGEWYEHHIEPAMTAQEIRAFGLWLDDMYDFDQPLRKAKSISDWSARFRADEDHALYMKRSELTGLQEERERIEALTPKPPEQPTEHHREEVEAKLKALAEKKRG